MTADTTETTDTVDFTDIVRENREKRKGLLIIISFLRVAPVLNQLPSNKEHGQWGEPLSFAIQTPLCPKCLPSSLSHPHGVKPLGRVCRRIVRPRSRCRSSGDVAAQVGPV